MCMQCMAGAMTATAGAAGIRAWLATRTFRWLTPKRLKAITVALVATALLASTVLVSGSGGTADATARPAEDGATAQSTAAPPTR